MGCGKSKGKAKCNFDMDPVNIPSIDTFLGNLSDPLRNLKDYHDNIDDALEWIYYYTGLHWYIKHPSFEQALKIFVFTAATAAENAESDLKHIVKLHSGPPFIEVDEDKIDRLTNGLDEIKNIYWYMKNLVRVLAEAPSRLKEIIESLKNACTSANEMIEKVKGEIGNSSMNALEKAKSIGRLMNNIGKLTNAPKIAQKLYDDLENMIKDIASFAKWFDSKEGYQQIKDVAKAAHKAKVYETWHIVGQFWPDKSELKGNKPPKKKAVEAKGGDKKAGGEKKGEHK